MAVYVSKQRGLGRLLLGRVAGRWPTDGNDKFAD
jgi:hypothetical protein